MIFFTFPTFHETPNLLGKNEWKAKRLFDFENSSKPLTVNGFRGFYKPPFYFWHSSWLYSTIKQKNMNRTINRKDFQKEVIENKNLALVQFKIEWNGACQIILPIYEELAKSYKGQASFFTVDVESEAGIDNEYGVMELPTILFFKSGKVIDHITGLTPKNVMISKIENALSADLN